MSPADWVVVGIGAALVLGEFWFFLGSRKELPRIVGGVQVVKVIVKGGYHPDTIPVEVGMPVRLVFYRDETAPCTEQVFLDELGIAQELPAFVTTIVQFTPKVAGDYSFRAKIATLRGRVVAQIGGDGARSNLGKGHSKHG